MTRVAIVGVSAVVRAGLEAVVRSAGFELSTDPAVADVVLASGRADDFDPQELPPIVLLSDGESGGREVLEAGFASVLPEDASPAEIAGALHAAAAGLLVIRREDLSPAPATTAGGALTAREIEVLRLLADGLPNKLIAHELGISENTVKYHVTSILSRLDASSRAEAVAIGLRRGFILL